MVLTGWKVVRLPERVSMWASYHGPLRDLSQAYPVGTRVGRPHGAGPLAVFTNAEDARTYVLYVNTEKGFGYTVGALRCRYKRSRVRSLFGLRAGGRKPDMRLPHARMPRGSDLADWVECLE